MRPFFLFVALTAGVLAGCAQSAIAPPALSAGPSSARAKPDATFTSIYSFMGAPDGAFPESSVRLFDNGATIVGTTNGGGSEGNRLANDEGTLFEISGGTERVLYSFGGVFGENPKAGVNVDGYGTTYKGGSARHGTLFLMEPSGGERILHSFSGGPDGAQPSANVTMRGDMLFGTTRTGGTNFQGTVYALKKKSGKESIVHSFTGYPSDGSLPVANLIDVKGTLYGTTSRGGAYNQGTVFSIKGHTESVLYSFKGAPDGAQPEGGLVHFNNALYGTTREGGSKRGNGAGTIFSVQLSGSEKVLHRFLHSEGTHPRAGFVVLGGRLFGTAASGGTGFGSVFEANKNGLVRVLHEFSGYDGNDPEAALTVYHGTLYGTTRLGGANGLGTVFSIKP